MTEWLNWTELNMEDKKWEKNYNKTETCAVSLKLFNALKGAMMSRKKDDLTAPELFDTMCGLQQKFI